jgi:hypothetical protein
MAMESEDLKKITDGDKTTRDEQQVAAKQVEPSGPKLGAANLPQPVGTLAQTHPPDEQSGKTKREMNEFEKSTITWARVAVLMSGAAAIFVCLQWYEMHTGGTDTHDLAVAASKQADWTEDLADRMKIQADNTFTLGKAAQEANNIAERQIRIAQRPWLKVVFLGDDPEHAKEAYNETKVVVGGALKIPLRIVNIGKTPAFHVIGNFVVELVPTGKEPNIPSGRENRRKFAVRQARTSVIYQDGGIADIPVERVGDLG